MDQCQERLGNRHCRLTSRWLDSTPWPFSRAEPIAAEVFGVASQQIVCLPMNRGAQALELRNGPTNDRGVFALGSVSLPPFYETRKENDESIR
jgi:hypothetical protein